MLINANRYALTPRTFQYLSDTSVNPATLGFPVDYAYSGEKVKMYPIPDGHYPVGFLGTLRATTLSLDADANVWTEDAYDLIRSEAKLILAQEVVHDTDLARECVIAIYGDPSLPKMRGYLSALKGETTRRRAQGRIIPTYF